MDRPSPTPDVDANAPTVLLRPAPPLRFPGAGDPGSRHYGETDCNSPAHWDGDTLYLFNSAGHPWRNCGADLLHLDGPRLAVQFDSEMSGGRWFESTWKAEDGTLYGWYHNEPAGICPERQPEPRGPAPAAVASGAKARLPRLTAPRIGAARSTDNGATWQDLGLILEGPAGALRCDTENFYFAGGNGDFSVVLDEQGEYLYFLFSTYPPDVAEQGVSVARMRNADRDAPVGKVWKWCRSQWAEPGLGGHVTPIFPVGADWHGEAPDAFWGASIHWNRHLEQYVIFLNRAMDYRWAQEGIYVTFSRDIADPAGWTAPRKILDREEMVSDPQTPIGWYPQVMGINGEQQETDKRAGRVARLFVHGCSRWEMVFQRTGEVG